MDADFILKALGFLVVLVGQVILVSRIIGRQGFKIEANNTLTQNSIEQNKKLEAKIIKLNDDLFPSGKPVFIYKEDCKGCHKDICDVINRGMADLKREFVKTDDARSKAHATLHRRVDEVQREVIILKAGNAK